MNRKLFTKQGLMAGEGAGGGGALSFSAAAVVEEVLLQQQGTRSLGDLDFESRKAEEASARRNEAAGWLRKMVGVVAARDLPSEPSEEEFRMGLRSGIILCNAINKVQPGVVPKVVESPCNAALLPDGAALSAFQYFENVRNFLVAVQEMGLPSFEASDLEQGGKSARVVNCVLGLKSYSEWKQTGGNGVWKFGGNVKTTMSGKSFARKNSEPFMNSLSRNSSLNEFSLNNLAADVESNKMSNGNGSLSMLVRAVLLDKKPEEIPTFLESVLSKVVEEFEHRMSNECNMVKMIAKDTTASQGNNFFTKPVPSDNRSEENKVKMLKKEVCFQKSYIPDEELRNRTMKQRKIFEEQQRDIEDLKYTLHATKAGMQLMQMKVLQEFNNLGMHIQGLAYAASGYHKVLEENRKLYNQVQDLKGSIRVYCRVRPLLSRQSSYLSTVDHLEDGIITINTSTKHGKGQKSFNFNKVFGPSATQAEVFADMQPFIRSILDGYNVCIFAYGQTGSGKTHTMTGPKDLMEENQGVNYRALRDLFLLAEQRKDIFRYNVAVQMIEIYNEQVRDLLVTDGSNKRLEIRNNSQTGLSVPDANLVPVSSASDVVNLMNLGQRNRAVGATALNDRSSRSHSCLTVHVQGRDLTSGTVLRGCMHLVDLAGSERVDKSEATGDRLKEAQHINKSLSALGDVIASLAQKNPHVPYRNSKLTQLLQDSLGGQAKTLMFVHISPELDAVGETVTSLKFAERVATVELGAAKVNKDNADAKELKAQIASLKAELARKGGNAECFQFSESEDSNRNGRIYSESSPFNYKPQFGDINDGNKLRQPLEDVGGIEVHTNAVLRQKRQSCDLDELLANSPPWPPVITPSRNNGEDEKEIGSGEWVDKVMVNKLDAVKRAEDSPACWETSKGNLSDVFLQKYLSDSPNIFSDPSYGMFMGMNQLSFAATDMDDLDVGTSDSSEPELLWQYKHTKNNISDGIDSQTTKTKSKVAKNSHLISRNLNPMLGPSPSRKAPNGVGNPLHRNGRQVASTDGKRRTGNKK